MNPTPVRSLAPPTGWLGRDHEDGGVSARFLAAATLLAAVVRLVGLTQQSLWVDEILTWRAVRPGAGLEFLVQIRDAVQGPLYMAVVWPLVRIADPELMLRLPSAVAGVLTVPAFGLVAARLAPGRAARLAVLLLAINPFLVWYSQEARGYSFAVLFGVLMVGSFVRILEDGLRPARAVAFALAAGAAIVSNMSALFLWLALAVSLPLRRPAGRTAWAAWIGTFAGGLVLALPWLLQAAGIWAVDRVVPGAATGEILRGETTLAPGAVPYTLFTFFHGFTFGPSLAELHLPDRSAALLGSLPAIALGTIPVLLAAAGLLRTERRRSAMLAVWVAVPFAVLVLLAVRNVKPWNARYVAVTLPWVLLLASMGIARLERRLGGAAAVLLCGCALVSLAGMRFDDRYAREDVRSAASFVAEGPAPERAVLVPVVTGVWRFYSPDGGPVITSYGAGPLRTPAQADAFVAERLAGVGEAWVVLAREWDFDPRGLLPAALDRAGTVTAAGRWPGVRLLAWRAAPRGPEGPHGG